MEAPRKDMPLQRTLRDKCNASIVDEDMKGEVSLFEGCNKLLCFQEGGEVQRHEVNLDFTFWNFHSQFLPQPSQSLNTGTVRSTP